MDDPNRRKFLKSSILASAGATMAFRFEEEALLAHEKGQHEPPSPAVSGEEGDELPERKMPFGKIGKLSISRLICGGNLFSGFAHSRDLIYVSALLRHYFTDEKVMETLGICEENGINTAILRVDDHILRIMNTYWKERGGKIQWIAQAKLPDKDWKADIRMAVDSGAHAVYVHGGVAEGMVEQGKLDRLAAAVEAIRENGLPAGMAGHRIEVPIAMEEKGIDVDFYLKTLNAKNYWSAGPEPRNDSVWAETPEKTIDFMRKVKKPWIAYKILGAGAIPPEEGFEYAFRNGADFICVGMFDFQVKADTDILTGLMSGGFSRLRPWMA